MAYPNQIIPSPSKKLLQMDYKDSYGFQLSEEELKQIENQPVIEYCETNYYPTQKVSESDIERINYGLNRRILNNAYPMNYEIDIVL